jgi:hypothetical protein
LDSFQLLTLKEKVSDFPIPSRDVTITNSPWPGIIYVHTDKKENKLFLINKEIPDGSGCKVIGLPNK